MATTRFTKSLHPQATKHNNAGGGFTNFIKRGPVGECKPIMGVWHWSPRAPVGSWFRASSQKKLSAFCRLTNKGQPLVVWVS